MAYRILSLKLIVAAIVATFLIPVTVTAGGGAPSESTQTVSAEKTVEGTLTALESYGHILIKPETGNLVRLRVPGNAIITRNGKPAKFADLRFGDKVQANYDSKSFVSELHATGK